MKSQNIYRRDNSVYKYSKDFYEFKPYLFGGMAFICFMNKNYNGLLFYSGLIFAFASAAIFYMRYFHRNYR
jgi:hypothetical protein